MSVPSNLPAWQELKAHHAAIADLHLRDLFATDPGRFAKFSRRFGDLLVDFSKHRITEETLRLLAELARQVGVPAWAERMGNGDGRFYHIFFTASDGNGGSCSGEVLVVVPRNRGVRNEPVDGGALYDSTEAFVWYR